MYIVQPGSATTKSNSRALSSAIARALRRCSDDGIGDADRHLHGCTVGMCGELADGLQAWPFDAHRRRGRAAPMEHPNDVKRFVGRPGEQLRRTPRRAPRWALVETTERRARSGQPRHGPRRPPPAARAPRSRTAGSASRAPSAPGRRHPVVTMQASGPSASIVTDAGEKCLCHNIFGREVADPCDVPVGRRADRPPHVGRGVGCVTRQRTCCRARARRAIRSSRRLRQSCAVTVEASRYQRLPVVTS